MPAPFLTMKCSPWSDKNRNTLPRSVCCPRFSARMETKRANSIHIVLNILGAVYASKLTWCLLNFQFPVWIHSQIGSNFITNTFRWIPESCLAFPLGSKSQNLWELVLGHFSVQMFQDKIFSKDQLQWIHLWFVSWAENPKSHRDKKPSQFNRTITSATCRLAPRQFWEQ